MAALTANTDAARSDGHFIAALVGAGKTVFQNALVVFDGAGNVQPLASGAAAPAGFAGVSRRGPTVGGGDATQADYLASIGKTEISRDGIFTFADADASPFIGQLVFGIDDQTVSGTAGTTSIKVGTIVDIPATGFVRVQIDNYVQ